MIQVLLDFKADPNAVTGDSWTSVGRLCSAGVSPEGLKLLIQRGAQVEFGAGNNTPLQIAARHDVSGEQLVELLLQNGASVHALGGDFGTALLAALHRPAGSDPSVVLKVVSNLIQYGADVNLAPDGHQPPIMKAAMQNWTIVVALLLKHNATIPRPEELVLDDGGATRHNSILRVPFLGRLDPSQSDMFHLLLEHGAHPDGHTALIYVGGYRGKTILGFASSSSELHYYKTAVSLLKSGANPNCVDRKGWTALQCAAYALSLDHVRLLLDHGAQGMEGAKLGGSPWHSLCRGVLQKQPLTEREAETFLNICGLIDFKWSSTYAWIHDEHGQTCLHYLAHLGNETNLAHNILGYLGHSKSAAASIVISFLSKHCMELDFSAFLKKDNDGRTALHIAAAVGDAAFLSALIHFATRIAGSSRSLIQYFLEHGDLEGQTALHTAASHGHILACRFLAEQSYTSPSLLLTKSGKSPAECAHANEYYKVAEYLSTWRGVDTADELARRTQAFLQAALERRRTIITEGLVDRVLRHSDSVD